MNTKLLTIALLVTASQLATTQLPTATTAPAPTTTVEPTELRATASPSRSGETHQLAKISPEELHKAVKEVASGLESTLEQRFQEDFNRRYPAPIELATAH